MTEQKNETSLHVSVIEPEEEIRPTQTPELNACLKIVQKPHDTRRNEENNQLVKRIMEMDIFDKYVLENLDPKSVITKLLPFFKYECLPAGSPIFHYEHAADKFYIILKGKAREFEPKDIETIEKESRAQYRSDPIPKNAVLSLPELPDAAPLGSLSMMKNAPFQSLNSLEVLWEEDEKEKDQEEAKDKANNALKRFRKMKAVLPFLKKMLDQKTATQRITDYNYKKALRKQKSIQRTLSQEDLAEPNLENFDSKLDESILEEFKRYPKSYFIGGVLKVKFLRYLYAGDYCGLRALTENSLRNRAVLAEEDCHCLSLSREDFLKILDSEKELNADKIEFFRKMFDKFETRRVMKFSLLWNCQTLNKGDTVFQQGEASDHLFALSHGDVVLSKVSENTQNRRAFIGQELPFRIKKKQEQQASVIRVSTVCTGDIFGGETFFQGSGREFTATVSSVRAKIFRLPVENYQESQKQFWDMYKEIKSIMSLKIKWNKERLEELSNKQSLTQSNFLPSSNNPTNEKVKKEIAKFLHYAPKRPTNTLDVFEKPQPLSDNIASFESPNRTTTKAITSYVFEHHYNVDGKLGTKIKEKIRFGSPQNFPIPKSENLEKVNLKNSAVTDVSSPPLSKEKASTMEKPSFNFLENVSGVEDSTQLFSRGGLPKYYANKNEEVAKVVKDEKNVKMDIFGPKVRTPRRANTINPNNHGPTRSASIHVLKKKVLESRASDVFASKLQPAVRRPSIELDLKPENLHLFKTTNAMLSPSFASLGHIKTEKSSKKFKLLLLSNTPQKKPAKSRADRDRQSMNNLELSDKLETKRNVSLAHLELTSKGPELILINEPSNFFSHGCPANSKIFSSSTRSRNIIKSLNNLQPVTLGTDRDVNFERENCKGFKTVVTTTNQMEDGRSMMTKVPAVRILHS